MENISSLVNDPSWWFSELLIPFVIGLVLIAIAFYINLHEKKIRIYLANSKEGYLKKRYVKVFLSAINGGAATSDARAIALIPVIFAFIFLFVVALMFLTAVNLNSKLKIEYAENANLLKSLENPEPKNEKSQQPVTKNSKKDSIAVIKSFNRG
jgi:hypothetical protein